MARRTPNLNPEVCPLCGLLVYARFARHLTVAHTRQCGRCGGWCIDGNLSQHNYRRHWLEVHGEPPPPRLREPPLPVVCPQCRLLIPADAWRAHEGQQHTQPCPLCDARCVGNGRGRRTLRHHLQAAHGQLPPARRPHRARAGVVAAADGPRTGMAARGLARNDHDQAIRAISAKAQAADLRAAMSRDDVEIAQAEAEAYGLRRAILARFAKKHRARELSWSAGLAEFGPDALGVSDAGERVTPQA